MSFLQMQNLFVDNEFMVDMHPAMGPAEHCESVVFMTWPTEKKMM